MPSYYFDDGFNTASGKRCCNNLDTTLDGSILLGRSFNTASGKRCCNAWKEASVSDELRNVSIPQAVSAVATGVLVREA